MTFSDHLFAQEQHPVPPFRFDERVARVFDNMIRRSVPLYQEILRGQAELAACFYQDNTVLYDLGCSNGNFELELLEVLRRPMRLVAVDSSAAMMARGKRVSSCSFSFRRKATASRFSRPPWLLGCHSPSLRP